MNTRNLLQTQLNLIETMNRGGGVCVGLYVPASAIVDRGYRQRAYLFFNVVAGISNIGAKTIIAENVVGLFLSLPDF